jgi:hypothetical protein
MFEIWNEYYKHENVESIELTAIKEKFIKNITTQKSNSGYKNKISNNMRCVKV